MLVLGACTGPAPEETTPEGDAPAVSDGGTTGDGTGEEPEEDTSEETSEGGTDDGADDTAGSDDDEDETGGAADPSDAGGETTGQLPRVVYVADGVEDVVDTSAETWMLGANDAAAALEAAGFTDVTCEDDVAWVQGAVAGCHGSFDVEGVDSPSDVAVYGVRAPLGFEEEEKPALLVSFRQELDEAAVDAFTDPTSQLVGVGQGSMFGSEELSAEDLAGVVDSTMNSENGFAPIEEEMSVLSCEGPMPAATPAPVACEVAWAHAPRIPLKPTRCRSTT